MYNNIQVLRATEDKPAFRTAFTNLNIRNYQMIDVFMSDPVGWTVLAIVVLGGLGTLGYVLLSYFDII